MSYKRKITREVRVGDVKIGGNNPISLLILWNRDGIFPVYIRGNPHALAFNQDGNTR